MPITTIITGSAQVSLKFRSTGANIVPFVAEKMLVEMAKLMEYVRSSKLSGQVLNRISGNLSKSLHPGVVVNGSLVVGTVGTNIEYAKVHEVGGTFDIPEYQRMQTMAWGRPMLNPRLVTVGAHKATFATRAFLRPSLDERKDAITESLRASIVGYANAA